MKNIFFIFMFVGIAFSLPVIGDGNAYIQLGKGAHNFTYTNSGGTEDPSYLSKIVSNYAVGYSHSWPFGLMAQLSIGHYEAGAYLNFEDENLEWNLDYLRTQLEVGYFFPMLKASPYLLIGGYASHLSHASQEGKDSKIDLLSRNKLLKNDYGFSSKLGVQYKLMEKMQIRLEAEYGMGLYDIESAGKESTFNQLFSFNSVLSFNLF